MRPAEPIADESAAPPPPPPPPRRRRLTHEQLDKRMDRIAAVTVERMVGAEAVPQIGYDDVVAEAKAAFPNARIEEIEIPASGIRIKAWLVKPPPETPLRGTVLALHPWQSNRAFALKQFGFLLQYGYQLFIPDARNNEFIGRGESFNAYLREDLDDIARALDYLRRRPDVGPLAAYGCAWGGLKAILAGERHPELQVVISDAGTLHYGLILVDYMNRMPPAARRDWNQVNRFIDKVRARLAERLGYDIDRFDPRDVVSRLNRPLLIVHSTDDTFVPIQVSEEIYQAAQPPKTFLRGKTFGHCNGMHQDPGKYIPRILVFLERHLPAPER